MNISFFKIKNQITKALKLRQNKKIHKLFKVVKKILRKIYKKLIMKFAAQN